VRQGRADNELQANSSGKAGGRAAACVPALASHSPYRSVCRLFPNGVVRHMLEFALWDCYDI